MTVFRAMLDQLGLSPDRAAAILGQSPITVRRKSQGVRNATDADVKALRDFWFSVQRSDVDKLPGRVREAALAAGSFAGSAASMDLAGGSTKKTRPPDPLLDIDDMTEAARYPRGGFVDSGVRSRPVVFGVL